MSFKGTTLDERLQPSVPPSGERQSAVFIVDDEPMVGEVVGMVLGIEGYKARVFTCAEDALEALESAAEKPDVLITDFAMTPVNGLELIQRFKHHVPAIRTILYSGALTEQESEAFKNYADAFLSKPFLPKELILTVKSVAVR